MKRAEIKKRPMSDTVLAALEPEAKEYREPFEPPREFRRLSDLSHAARADSSSCR